MAMTAFTITGRSSRVRNGSRSRRWRQFSNSTGRSTSTSTCGGIEISYTWGNLALQGAGLVKKRSRRGTHRRRRPRRSLPGMLLHIDASKHAWFGDGRHNDLITILDDATSEIYYAQLVEEEGTRTLMPAVREVVEKRGIFCALYSDRASHFFVTPKAGGKVDPNRVTQLGRALGELGIDMIPAYSPQARGRMERSYRTWQGRGFRRRCASGRGEPLPAVRIHARIQPAFSGEAGGHRQRVSTHATEGSGLGVCAAARADGQSRPHHRCGEPDLANRQNTMAGHAGGMRRDGIRVSGWEHGGAVRPTSGGAV